MTKRQSVEAGQGMITALAAGFFAIVTWTSWARWANFEYRTFDLAYYVQAIWQLIHGRFEVSVEHVPLLGNHVEPIVFLFAPLFALFRHPMLFVVVQNAALAAMGPIGYRIARRLRLDATRALLLGAILLLAPAAGYIALHEFHPEALTAPFLLLMLDARLGGSIRRHWLWLLAALACKENMALLIAAYCVVNLVVERARGWKELRRWYLGPLLAALLWFVLCSKVITPAFNSGSIDYVTLYDRLGNSGPEILRNAIMQPQLIGDALWQSLTHGNLIWALLFPFLALPLLRPRWLIISAPVLLQHLLSWRSSEWTIYFHYAAPLLPLFWMAAVETVAKWDTVGMVDANMEGAAPSVPSGTRPRLSLQRWIPVMLLIACVVGQIWLGPIGAIGQEMADWPNHRTDRLRKIACLEKIPAAASVVAGLPYLSHLAMREKLYSLHYILKGLKTLSHATYQPPPPTDYVFIDYKDGATFDPGAGYYHPAMRTKDERVVASSDVLLATFLTQAHWLVEAQDEFALFRREEKVSSMAAGDDASAGTSLFTLADGCQLVSLTKSGDALTRTGPLTLYSSWKIPQARTVIPWMVVRIKQGEKTSTVVTVGLCAPEASSGFVVEAWAMTRPPDLRAGTYAIEALFFDHSARAWKEANSRTDLPSSLLSPPVPMGDITIQ